MIKVNLNFNIFKNSLILKMLYYANTLSTRLTASVFLLSTICRFIVLPEDMETR